MFKNWKLFRRRNFLLGLGAFASTVFFDAATTRLTFYQKVQAFYNSKRSFSVVSNASLRQRAAVKGLIYGAFPSVDYYSTLSGDKQLQSTFIRQCGLIVGGFYWSGTQPSASTFNFTETDSFARFASKHGMLFRGHPLVWYNLIPEWLTNKFKDPRTSSKEIENILINHVSTIVKRYAGRIHSWDVVNEAIYTEDGRTDGLGRSQWLKFLGPDYIDLAFRVAAQADPKALLVYNETALESDNPQHEARRTAVLKLLERLKSRGVPIHAFGIQSHLWGNETPFSPKKLKKFLADVASLGLKILVSELDVADKELPKDIGVRDRIIASVYEDYLSVVLDEPAVIAVITWGLSDRHTWISDYAPRPDGAPVRPLPFDSNLKPKLAWNAMARAFDKAPKRTPKR
ncbi:MAG: endo-1,4-beta-xylanase [Iphinoe sp. HA4291-MV1]|jgi:endo-1,4-beta-xylanase|nr:endo-1,4-beta-xylanase [Iphinoe sp. HA4291-MV1]